MKKTCLTLAVLMFISTTSTYAQSTKSLNTQLQNNVEKQQDVSEEIMTLDTKIKDTEKAIQESDIKLEGINNEIEEVNKDIEQLEKSIEENNELLGKRLRASNKNLSLGYIQILFKSENITDFLTNLYSIKEIVTYDKNIIEELARASESLDSKKKDLTLKQDEIKLLSDDLNKKKIGLEEDKKQLGELKAKLENEENDIEKKISEILSVNNITGGDNNNYIVSNNGWPVQGHTRISSPYGMRMHPVLKVRKMHTGIDIPAPTGTNVLTIDNGTVIFAGVQSGYGNTVMIRHDDGKVSLYAHNSRLTVGNGQRVSKGQVIAKIGSTGRSTGPHLHFEIRINGSHVNPINYLR
jgi:murein DD-endopeptidase MepM/ murein hydrolase activator NlpD